MATKQVCGEPYSLAGRRMAFTNWYYVRPCVHRWYNSQGESVWTQSTCDALDAQIRRINEPWGIRLRVNRPQRSGPIIQEERPWEEGGVGFSVVLKDDGVYRAWAQTGWGDSDRAPTRFCCYESQDGLSWRRPSCGIMEHEGSKENNLLGAKGGAVFIDPSTPPAERYKWVNVQTFRREVFDQFKHRFPSRVDAKCDSAGAADADVVFGIEGAFSSDGYHWTIIKEPLALFYADAPVVAYYDARLRKYVGYFREWVVGPTCAEPRIRAKDGHRHWKSIGRRAVGRAETDDFRQFPLSEVVLEPHLAMTPSQTLYVSCKTAIPGAPENHLMFPTVWDTASDATHVTLATSHDGITWSYAPHPDVLLETAEFGQWDGGCLFTLPNLIELPNGEFALPYCGFDVPHKYPRGTAKRATGYAVWPKGRLMGIEARERGEFATVGVVPMGQTLRINAVTARAGSILVEAADLDGTPLPGRDFASAIPVRGDGYQVPVAWRDHDALGLKQGEGVILRIRMDRAILYWLDFV